MSDATVDNSKDPRTEIQMSLAAEICRIIATSGIRRSESTVGPSVRSYEPFDFPNDRDNSTLQMATIAIQSRSDARRGLQSGWIRGPRDADTCTFPVQRELLSNRGSGHFLRAFLRHDKSINKSSYERISPRERERDLRKFSNETPREFYSFAKGERIGEYFPRYGSQSEPRNSIIFVVFEDVRGDLVNKNSLTQRGCRNVTIICLFNERNRKEVEERKDLR